MAFLRDYKHDVFLSYASVSDIWMVRDGEHEKPWPVFFRDRLRDACALVLGRKGAIDIYFDQDRLKSNAGIDAHYRDALEKSALFVGLVSKGFLHRGCYCRKEVRLFKEAQSERPELGEIDRLWPVLLEPVDRKRVQALFAQDARGMEFFTDEEPLPKSDGSLMGKFGKQMARLAQEICDTLQLLQRARRKEREDLAPHPQAPSSEKVNLRDPSGTRQAIIRAEPRNGIILSGGIVDFTNVRPRDQQGVILKMWDFLERHRTVREHCLVKSSTLDGAMLALRWPDPRDNICLQRVAIDLAVDWIKFMLEQNRMAFRVGIELGEFVHFGLPLRQDESTVDQPKVVGPGPNDCDRIARLGDAYDILISEAFFASWELDDGDARRHVSEQPLVIYPKPNREQSIRIYTGHRSKKSETVPPLALRRIHAADKSMPRVLEFVCDSFKDEIEVLALTTRGGSALSADIPETFWPSAAIRVSVFAPEPNRASPRLVCTNYRYLDSGGGLASAERERLLAGNTIYSSDGRGRGPAGTAFASGKPYVLTGLPDYESEPNKYVARFSKNPLALPPGTVRAFGRKARTFVCFPCSLSDDMPVDGVACIDLMHDLAAVGPGALLELAEQLRRRYGQYLALLLQTRR